MSEYDEQPDLAPEEDGSEQGAADEWALAPDDAASDGHAVTGDGSEASSTGVAAVDDVLASVQALDGRPVEEHVAVFEQAHEHLRRALDPGHG
jgi:hypothetical protein